MAMVRLRRAQVVFGVSADPESCRFLEFICHFLYLWGVQERNPHRERDATCCRNMSPVSESLPKI